MNSSLLCGQRPRGQCLIWPRHVALPHACPYGRMWDTGLLSNSKAGGKGCLFPATPQAGPTAHPFPDMCPGFPVYKIQFNKHTLSASCTQNTAGHSRRLERENTLLVLQKFTDSQNPQGEKGYRRDQKRASDTEGEIDFSLGNWGHFLELVAFKTGHEWNRNLTGEGQDAQREDTAEFRPGPEKGK